VIGTHSVLLAALLQGKPSQRFASRQRESVLALLVTTEMGLKEIGTIDERGLHVNVLGMRGVQLTMIC
jgi:hypothetical protein